MQQLTLLVGVLQYFDFYLLHHSIQLFMTSVTKAVLYAVLYGMVHRKEPLLLIQKIVHVVAAAGFFSSDCSFTICLMSYNVNRMC